MILDGGSDLSTEPGDQRHGAALQAPLCAVNNLTVEVIGDAGSKTVVQDISFQIRKGNYFALVGESGSGKSVTCHALMGLLPFHAKVSGHVVIDGADVFSLKTAGLRQFRRRSVGMIFQDPLAALNPVRTVGSQLIETLHLHYPVRTPRRIERACHQRAEGCSHHPA